MSVLATEMAYAAYFPAAPGVRGHSQRELGRTFTVHPGLHPSRPVVVGCCRAAEFSVGLAFRSSPVAALAKA